MKKFLLIIVLLLSSCSNREIDKQTSIDDNTQTQSKVEEIDPDQVIDKFKLFIEEDLVNFELDIDIDIVQINRTTDEETEMNIRGEIIAIDEKNYYMDIKTYLDDSDFGIEFYNIFEDDHPLIYMKTTFKYQDWISTTDIAKTDGYTSDQFNNLIIIPDGTVKFIETKKIRGKEYYHVYVEIDDSLVEELLAATNSTREDLNIGKLKSNFYLDENGIPYIIKSNYITSNSILDIKMELRNVGAVKDISIPEKIIKNAINIDKRD